MGTRRKFTLEFKTGAGHRVIDTGRSVRRGGGPAVGGQKVRSPGGSATNAGAWRRWRAAGLSRSRRQAYYL